MSQSKQAIRSASSVEIHVRLTMWIIGGNVQVPLSP
jgi:hypothetical protein